MYVRNRILPWIATVQCDMTGNEEHFKKSFTMVFQMLLCGECYENVCT
jgi:hypothetical protein